MSDTYGIHMTQRNETEQVNFTGRLKLTNDTRHLQLMTTHQTKPILFSRTNTQLGNNSSLDPDDDFHLTLQPLTSSYSIILESNITV